MRGSTPIPSIAGMFVFASPAHAGIDPLERHTRGDWTGLPRACGDRPFIGVSPFHQQLPPPRMRGSTCKEDPAAACAHASPAHAGIDLLSTAPLIRDSSLPRACGDRPAMASL